MENIKSIYTTKKPIITIIITVLCVSAIFSGCNNSKVQNQSKGGIKIANWSSSLGSVNETDLDKSVFSYSINLTNENEKNIFIEFIQPLVNETIKNKILSKETVVTVNQNIKPKETIKVNGEIIIDTKGLSKQDIDKLEPFITDIKVSTEDTISLKQ